VRTAYDLTLYLRKQALSLRQAIGLQEAAKALLVGREHMVAFSAVLALAVQSGRSAYDCELLLSHARCTPAS
jgi:hypothetical protein